MLGTKANLLRIIYDGWLVLVPVIYFRSDVWAFLLVLQLTSKRFSPSFSLGRQLIDGLFNQSIHP